MLLWKNNNKKAGGLMSLPPEADYFSNYSMSQSVLQCSSSITACTIYTTISWAMLLLKINLYLVSIQICYSTTLWYNVLYLLVL